MTAPTEREVLEALFAKVFPEPSRDGWRPAIGYSEEWHAWRHRREAFRKMLDAKAYESAALMLVPRGWIVEIVRSFDDDGAFFSTVKLTDSFTIGRGCDPDEEVSVTARKGAITTFHDPTALAICAAIEAALARECE